MVIPTSKRIFSRIEWPLLTDANIWCRRTLSSSPRRTTPLRVEGKHYYFLNFFVSQSNWERSFWPSALSYFSHVHLVATALKFIVRTRCFVSLVCRSVCFVRVIEGKPYWQVHLCDCDLNSFETSLKLCHARSGHNWDLNGQRQRRLRRSCIT